MTQPKKRRATPKKLVITGGAVAALAAAVTMVWDGRGAHTLTLEQALEVIHDPRQPESNKRTAMARLHELGALVTTALQGLKGSQNAETARTAAYYLTLLNEQSKED